MGVAGGELQLVASTVEECTSTESSSNGLILHVTEDALLIVTSTEFRQSDCARALFRQDGGAQVYLYVDGEKVIDSVGGGAKLGGFSGAGASQLIVGGRSATATATRPDSDTVCPIRARVCDVTVS